MELQRRRWFKTRLELSRSLPWGANELRGALGEGPGKCSLMMPRTSDKVSMGAGLLLDYAHLGGGHGTSKKALKSKTRSKNDPFLFR